MRQCVVCGNTIERPLEVAAASGIYQFDRFECAVQALAPACQQCGRRVIGRFVDSQSQPFTCTTCEDATHSALVAGRA